MVYVEITGGAISAEGNSSRKGTVPRCLLPLKRSSKAFQAEVSGRPGDEAGQFSYAQDHGIGGETPF